MGLGMLNSRQHVAGTVVLLETENTANVVLVPNPSQSSLDPLRWPRWKKDLTLFGISLCAGLGGIQGVCLSVATAQIAEELKISILKAETLNTYQFLAVGGACAIAAICSRIFGKRPVYLLSAILELAAAIWNVKAVSYSSVLGSRILYGLGIGAFESLVLATIGDIYYVHERGRGVAFYSFLALGCSQLSPILGGHITDRYGWRTQLWILVAFWVTALLLLFFCCPETSFDRPLNNETNLTIGEDDVDSSPINTQQHTTGDTNTEKPMVHDRELLDGRNGDVPRSYMSELVPLRRPGNGLNPLSAILRFFITGFYPIVWFSFVVVSTYLAWFVGISITLAQVFASPPILFTATKLGYLNTFGFPCALAAELVLHLFADRSCKWLARRNNNLYEPEFRLVMIIPAIIVSVIAFSLFGWYVGKIALTREIDWVVASFIWGMIVFSLVVGQSVSFSYLLDAHSEISIEAGMFVVMLRNFFSYGAGTFLPRWLERSGVATTFYTIAGLQGGLIAVLSVFFFVFGKSIRSYMSRHSPMKALHVDVAPIE